MFYYCFLGANWPTKRFLELCEHVWLFWYQQGPNTVRLRPFLRQLLHEKCLDQLLQYCSDRSKNLIHPSTSYDDPTRRICGTQVSPLLRTSSYGPHLKSLGDSLGKFKNAKIVMNNSWHIIPMGLKFWYIPDNGLKPLYSNTGAPKYHRYCERSIYVTISIP